MSATRFGMHWAVVGIGLVVAPACGRTLDPAPRHDAVGGEPEQTGGARNAAGAEDEMGGQPITGAAGSDATDCGPELMACSGRCVDARFNPQHCGSCDNVCTVGELCSAGICATSCLAGSTECDKRCVDVDWDPNNCGECGRRCADGEVCSRGACGLECVGGSTRCGDTCVDLSFHPLNCGGCGKTCAEGAVCTNGACQSGCAAGSIECGGACVNPALDLANCGACGHVCELGLYCSAGLCTDKCVDSIPCGAACIDPLIDSANCGGCGKVCSPGETCQNGSCGLHCDLSSETECWGACVDTDTDSQHCGHCGNACTNGFSCQEGTCTCGNGKVSCQGGCVDTATDTLNCSVCGNACGTNETCVDSSCECKDGTERCGDRCIDTSISAANCGGCGKDCPAGKVCTGGRCEAATGAWQTFQANVQHTGENAEELGKPPLRFGWQLRLDAPVHPVVGEAGRLFVTRSLRFNAADGLFALNVSDGSVLWKKNFGSLCCIGHPAVFNGFVYVANGKNSGEPNLLWSLATSNGGLNWYSDLSAQWEQYFAPIVADGAVYTNAGYYGGLYGVSLDEGTNLFKQTSLEQYDEWSPAYFNGNVYSYIAGTLRKHDRRTGAILAHTSVTWDWAGWSMQNAPVFGDSLAYLTAPPALHAVDPETSEVVWSATGAYSGTPAVADGLVYAISAGNLLVRNAGTGKLAWSFVADSKLRYPPVIANGHVYLASDEHVYGVDMATHEAVFVADGGGWLSVVNHRLLVAGYDGTLSAYIMSLDSAP